MYGRYSDLATGYGLDESQQGPEFSLLHIAQTGSGPTQPPIQWVPDAFSLGIKRPRREADHSPSTSAEVRKTCICTLTPHTSS
jgi:hypothetical protein